MRLNNRLRDATSVLSKGDDALLMFLRILGVLASVGVFTASGKAAEGWSVMKAGMNRVETTTALGDPLIRNIARGFEVWLYDGGAEVLCFQERVVAWTAPRGVKSPDGRLIDLRPFFLNAGAPLPVTQPAPTVEAELNLAPIRQMRLPKL
jgi:hypothetical protein